jgi:hypothetical protein
LYLKENNMKQTAVEWLVEQLNKEGFAQVVTDEEIQQAKEMEQEQLAKAESKGANEAIEALWRRMNDKE